MRQITISTKSKVLNGLKYTEIIPDDQNNRVTPDEINNAEWVVDWNGAYAAVNRVAKGYEYIIGYRLPALNAYPTVGDDELIGLYAAFGLIPIVKLQDGTEKQLNEDFGDEIGLITHCVDKDKNKYEVGINGYYT